MTLLAVGYFLVFFFFMIALVALWIRRGEDCVEELADIPFVSILVAARNEEANIISCLESIDKLNYPRDKFEVLIGDDASTDSTFFVVTNFISGKENFRLISIKEELGNAKGKANVLAHLAREARGEFYLITDADIKVPNEWVRGLVGQHEERVGIVSGVTMVEPATLFSKLQSLEWLFAFGMVKSVSDIGIPVTAVGNNMLISRKAYESVGGYETIPFSVTEDFELFRHILKKGWGYKNLHNPQVLAITKPIETFSLLLRQRKRWMTGALKLPLILVICLFCQALFFPAIVTAMILVPAWGGLLWLMKILLQQVFLALVLRRIAVPGTILKYFLLFELYSGILSFSLLIYYLLPGGVVWKGRKYS